MFSNDYRADVIKWQLRLLRSLGLSDKTIGFFVRAAHVHAPIYIVIYITYIANIWGAIASIVALLFGFVYFILFNGCVLSKLEQLLDSEDITIVDPFLELAHFPKTNKNRMNISLVFGSGYVVFCALIAYHRFAPSSFPKLLQPL